MATTNFLVSGMHCGGCANTVRQRVEQVPGVRGLTVDPSTGMLAVDGDEDLDGAAVLAAVEQAGYEAVRA
ncbi:heavy-metal-associated domain-containing protein [Pseudactinotalea terrae]|uniref:heavy-metal-associated domain-containing protein n=1 Tax=Pseudactinotalea terrae TaxID=1743262 RepID=UPI0019D5E966|nr:heavy metal-associated domain-containing protein [Pseudactinotalea terrae]